MFRAPTVTAPKKSEFQETPAGTYTMALQSLSLIQGETNKLKAFFIHTGDNAKMYKGVNYNINLDGTFEDGTPKAVKVSTLAYALGASEGSEIGVDAIGSLEEGKEWAGAPAALFINGDRADFTGKLAGVVVEGYTYNGKSGVRAKAVFRPQS